MKIEITKLYLVQVLDKDGNELAYEYVVGDNVRDIDWKASARSRKFLIKQYIAEKKHKILIIIDKYFNFVRTYSYNSLYK